MDLISVIVPCYNEEKSVRPLYDAVTAAMCDMDVRTEFIFADDGSSDGTLGEIKKLRAEDRRVRFVSLSRNFGKEGAMRAALEAAQGDYCVIIDADLQHPPEFIPKMYHAIKYEGYDSAAMRRVSRKGEPLLRSFFARWFYKLIARISETPFVDGATDYRMLSRRMTDACLSLCEYNRFTKGIYSWVGFKTKWIEFENVRRFAGESKWSFWRLAAYSIEGIVAFSTAPLMIASVLGILLCAAAALYAALIIVKTLLFGEDVAGFPTLACLVLFIGGVQLLVTGILGQYLAKTYLETKRRPVYIVKETEKD